MATDSPSVSILLIGDELLTGKIIDSNGSYALKKLTALGATVVELRVVRDNVQTISDAIKAFRKRSEWVITSGGIGPTHDDLTMKAVAHSFGVSLEHRTELQDHIDARFGENVERHRVWSQMAYIPAGCELIEEDGMFWPIYRMNNVYVLPGVPQIFVRQFDRISEQFRGAERNLTVLYLTVGEGRIAEPLTMATTLFERSSFGSYPVMGNADYRTRITVESCSSAELDEAVLWLSDRFEGEVLRVERNATVLS